MFISPDWLEAHQQLINSAVVVMALIGSVYLWKIGIRDRC